MTRIYLTDEHYAIALKNGITSKTLEARVLYRGWDLQRALTQPPEIKKTRWHYKKNRAKDIREAEENGINANRFYGRLRSGWSVEEAKTAEQLPRKFNLKSLEKARKKRAENARIKPEHIQKAEENGIKLSTLRQRVYRDGWDLERATTEKPKSKKL